jgi:hypothetical protein
MPKVVNINSGEHYDIYIGRGTKWGNPFTHREGTAGIVKVSSREEAIECYKNYIESTPLLLQAAKDELKGKNLGCHCHPKPCHGDVLLKIANEEFLIEENKNESCKDAQRKDEECCQREENKICY